MALHQSTSFTDGSAPIHRMINPSARPSPCKRCGAAVHGAVAGALCHLGNLDEAWFFIALCGLWTNTTLHALLTLLHAMDSAPTYTTACWSLATLVWGIIALSVHYMQHANRRLKSARSSYPYSKCTCTSNLNAPTQTLIGEALMLVAFMTWYRDAIAQRTAPYEALFAACLQPAAPGGRVCSTGGPRGMMFVVTQCDLANAIANVTWMGPVALLLATWAMLFAWLSRPVQEENQSSAPGAESEESLVPDEKSSAPAKIDIEALYIQ